MQHLGLQVAKGQSAGYPVYIGFAPINELAGVSFVDRYMMENKEGVQRVLDKSHAKDFRDYIQQPKGTAPPLILSLRVKARFEPRGNGAWGILHIPRHKEAMARLDAQHRMAFTEDLPVVLPFMIFFDLSEAEEVKIFTDFNDKHKGLTKSLVDTHRARLAGEPLKELQPHLAIAIRLNDDADSVWYKAVNTGGASATPGTKRKVNLRTLQQATKDLIAGPRCKNANFDKKYECVRNYWQAVANTFPNEWVDHRRHLITKGIGVHALSSVGRDVIEGSLGSGDTSVSALAKYLDKLRGFDWGNKTSLLSGFSGQKGVKLAADLLNRVVFGTATVDNLLDVAEKLKSA